MIVGAMVLTRAIELVCATTLHNTTRIVASKCDAQSGCIIDSFARRRESLHFNVYSVHF